MDLDGTVEGTAPGGGNVSGGNMSGQSAGSADMSGGGASGGGVGGGGGGASIDVGSLGISNSMSFTHADAQALATAVGQWAVAAAAAYSGNTVATTVAVMNALAWDALNQGSVSTAIGHLAHDAQVGLVDAAQQQASTLTGAPVSALGLWGTSTLSPQTGTVSIGTSVGEIQLALNAGAAVTFIAWQPDGGYQWASSGNGPQ